MRFLTGLFCFLMISPVLAKDFTLATVDMQKLFTAYPGTAPAQKKFDAFTAQKKKDLTDAAKVLKDLQNELSGDKGVLSAKAKQEKEEEFQQQTQDFETEKNDAQSELADRQAEMTQTLVAQIKEVVAKVAQAKGVDLVLDSNDIVGMKSGVDLTGDVLKSFSQLKLSAKTSDSDNP